MDPASAAGIALGASSLALQLLGGCIKSYEAFLSMAEMPSQYEHLRVRMRLEQTRLLHWGEKTGLLKDTMERPSLVLQLHRNIIVDILSEIQRLFRECMKLQTQVERVTGLTDAGPIALAPVQKAGLIAKAILAWDKTTEIPMRLKWALIKQEKFEGLIEKLISYNDSIVSLLDITSIRQLHDMQVHSHLTLLQLTTKIDDLHKLAMATRIHTTITSVADPGGQLPNSGSLAALASIGHDDFARLANFKAAYLELAAGGHANVSKLNRMALYHRGGDAHRPRALYHKNTNVWIEYKDYDYEIMGTPYQEMLESRVEKLVALLSIEDTPEEFRAPKCIGYVHDVEDDTARYGLVFKSPINDKSIAPSSLLTSMLTQAKPSLTQRIKLAHSLASSLMYLHSVNWLHKSIRSENVVFFVQDAQSPDYGAPILAGYEYSRPDLPEEQTEKPADDFEHDLRKHPDSLSRPDLRSKKSWDIYSFGVLLIEIALWRSISDVLDLKADHKGAWTRLRKVRDEVLSQAFLNDIGAEVGEVYQTVVKRCITAGTDLGIQDGADESDPLVGAELQRVFSEEIVAKLQAIHV